MKPEDLLVTIAEGGAFDVTEAIQELARRVLALENAESGAKVVVQKSIDDVPARAVAKKG